MIARVLLTLSALAVSPIMPLPVWPAAPAVAPCMLPPRAIAASWAPCFAASSRAAAPCCCSWAACSCARVAVAEARSGIPGISAGICAPAAGAVIWCCIASCMAACAAAFPE